MKTVKEVSRLTGVSVRTLHHYDNIGLLRPARTTEAGYRLYDNGALERLQIILLFRELKFPLKEIKDLLDRPDFDKTKALEQQMQLLQLQKEHIEGLMDLARGIKELGVDTMFEFKAFDKSQLEEFSRQARVSWGETDVYRQFEASSEDRSEEDMEMLNTEMMAIFKKLGALKTLEPSDPQVQQQIGRLQAFISEHFYECTQEILSYLGQIYACDSRFAEAIDSAGGKGTADFVKRAIEARA